MVAISKLRIPLVLGALLLLLACVLPTIGRAEPAIPPLTGRVVDNAHVLNSSTIEALTRRLESFERQTSSQIVVVTLHGLDGYSVEDWGLALLRGWGIGQKGRNNGVVLLVAPNDRQVRIEVGYGLEGALPDATAYRIIQREIIPHFKVGDIGGGVTAGINAIIAAVNGTYGPVSQASNSKLATLAVFALVGLVIILLVIWIVRSGRERRWDPEKQRYVWYWPTPDPASPSSRSSDSSPSGLTWGSSSSGSSFGGGGFSGRGGSGGGGGASGRW